MSKPGFHPCPCCNLGGMDDVECNARKAIREAEERATAALALFHELDALVETSRRWFHDSTLWEQESYDEYLPPQWDDIRKRAALLTSSKDVKP